LKIFDNGKVRKMTTREIGRLMGVDDDSIDKMIESGISSSNINNLFGNSIVVDVMVYMFDNLFNKEKEKNNLF
jgi:site-specific DNA-cytosine methylase